MNVVINNFKLIVINKIIINVFVIYFIEYDGFICNVNYYVYIYFL